jgi:hypothetical protein
MKVGQKVRIRPLKDRVNKEVSTRIGEVGVVKEPKILDGRSLGYIVKFTDNKATWFFSDELEAIA